MPLSSVTLGRAGSRVIVGDTIRRLNQSFGSCTYSTFICCVASKPLQVLRVFESTDSGFHLLSEIKSANKVDRRLSLPRAAPKVMSQFCGQLGATFMNDELQDQRPIIEVLPVE